MKADISLIGFTIFFGFIVGCKKTDEVYKGSKEKKWVVSTVAGDGSNSFRDGSAVSAGFSGPVDVAVMNDGSLYVTDSHNSRIRKIAGGQVSTFAGSSTSDVVNGMGASASFRYPYSITTGANGNLYVSDYDDARIREISGSGNVTTYAGSALPYFQDGPAASSLFFIGIGGLATDPQGNLYVADTYNMRVRRISAAGNVSTIAGSDTAGTRDGIGALAQFYYPSGVATDSHGNLFVSEPYGFRIRKITQVGEVTTFAGDGHSAYLDGAAADARFIFPGDMVVDSRDNLYVLDGSRVRKISAAGIVSTIAGSTRGYVDGDGAIARFNSPMGLGIDSDDKIYVADFAKNRIRKISFE